MRDLTTAEDLGSSSIKVILESESWRFISTKAKFGVYNTSGVPRSYSIKVTEIQDFNMLPPLLKLKYQLFDSVFNKADASQISQKERQRFNVCDKTEFTYGEVLFPYFIPLFELVKPQPGELFWDIGCGAGRPLAIVSLNFP
jgi:hypothetical protein